MAKRVSKDNLIEHTSFMFDNTNVLKRNQAYLVGQTVNKGQIVLKCVTAGITDTLALNLTSAIVGSTLTDGTVDWEVISITGYGIGSSSGGTSVSEWATGISYTIGDVVIYGNSLYRCTTAHTSSIFSSDAVNWTLIFADTKEWASNVYYTVGVTAIHNNKLYKCITAHTSISSFDGSKWQIIGDYVTAPIKIGEVGFVSWQYTLMANHLALNGATVNNFSATYPELYNFFDTNSLITVVMSDYTANKALCYYDSSTDTAILPDFLDKTIWGGGTIEEKQAGLPNVTGSAAYLGYAIGMSGAFKSSVSAGIHANTLSGANPNGYENCAPMFDASLSNPIYGNSQTVQPPAIQLIPQIRYSKDTVEGTLDSIYDWTTNEDYVVGDYVVYNNQIYRCNTNHTSSSFSTDISNWDMISGLQVWSATTEYKQDNLIYHGGKLYKATSDFTSPSLFDMNNLELISGGGLSEWEPSTTYQPNDIIVYDGQIYKVLTGYTSGATFSNPILLDPYTLIAWQANTAYVVGDIFEESGTLYEVINNFTSGSTFSITSDIQVYTPIAYASGISVSIGDIVSYSGNYYEAKQNIKFGDSFSQEALELYVPKPLTQAQIASLIQNFNPIMSGATGFVVYNNAGAHNALYRGKDLTDYFNSGDMSIAIASGTFEDIFPGDYIIKSVTVNGTTYADIKWIVGTLDYFLHNGDTECTTHHILMFPEICIGTAQMNTSNTSSGGYVGSRMWTTTIPLYVTGITNAFGSAHVLQHRELLTTSMDTNGRSSAYCTWGGAANNWAWQNVKVNIFNENMVYGGAQCSSSMYDTADGNHQVQAMRHNRQLMFTRSNWYWLRAVSGSTAFARCHSHGDADYTDASAVGGVRPYFLLY